MGVNFNTDALDLGEYSGTGEPSRGILVESCLMHDFRDKGVSMGVNVDVTVSNCVIHSLDAGIAVKDRSVAGLYNNTISDVSIGFACYNKPSPGSSTGGGFITNSFNNILWNCTNLAVSLLNGSTLTATYSDFANTNWPDTGNLSIDPLFEDPARHNYRLSPGSPLIGAGLDGATMGATYPVGGLPAPPLNLAALTQTPGAIVLTWTDDSGNEEAFLLQRSTGGGAWQTLGTAAADATSYADSDIALGQRYYYRLCATNGSGSSRFTGIVGALQTVASTGPRLELGADGKGIDGNGRFWLQADVAANMTVLVECSTNLSQWLPVQTNAWGGGLFEYSAPVSEGARFYRLLVSPQTP
jgi:hypothetical protein